MRNFIIKAFILLLSLSLEAQVIEFRKIGSPAFENSNLRTHAVDSIAEADSINLPFWDDFSNSLQLDSNLWQDNGTVTISNTIGILPPSVGVAVLDGVKADGQLHSNANSTASQATDSLVSKPIRLGDSNTSDGLFFSFYWQAQGLGDAIEGDDSLVVFFKDKDAIWVNVFKEFGNVDLENQSFTHESIPLTDERYIHDGFQFMFKSYGRAVGAFDHWCIDYITLDANRTGEENYADGTLRTPPSSILGDYYHVPAEIFEASPGSYLGNASTLSNNLDALGGEGVFNEKGVGFEYQFINADNEDTLFVDSQLNADPGSPNTPSIRPFEVLPLTSRDVVIDDLSQVLEDSGFVHIKIACESQVFDETPGRERNNTAESSITIDSVLAYDDGTAEIAAGISTIGDLALGYELPEGIEDTITGVFIQFPETFTEVTGLPILDITIWSSDSSGAPGSVERVVPNKPAFKATQLNELMHFEIPNTIVSGSFFVGYHQDANGFVGVGLDMNGTDQGGKAWFRVVGDEEWLQEPSFSGTLMIRPVFGKTNGIIARAKSSKEIAFDLFPHPNQDNIFNLKGNFESVKLVDLKGSQVKEVVVSKNLLDASDVKSGVYFAVISFKENIITKKIIIQ